MTVLIKRYCSLPLVSNKPYLVLRQHCLADVMNWPANPLFDTIDQLWSCIATIGKIIYRKHFADYSVEHSRLSKIRAFNELSCAQEQRKNSILDLLKNPNSPLKRLRSSWQNGKHQWFNNGVSTYEGQALSGTHFKLLQAETIIKKMSLGDRSDNYFEAGTWTGK